MEFTFTEEQEMIRDTAAAFLAEVSTSAAVRAAMATEQGYDSALWTRICTGMCWQAIHIPAEFGGMGLGYVELVATMEQMGRFLLCSPYFSTVCLAANALLAAGSDEQKAEWLGRLCADGVTATVACNGGASDWGADSITATWRKRLGTSTSSRLRISATRSSRLRVPRGSSRSGPMWSMSWSRFAQLVTRWASVSMRCSNELWLRMYCSGTPCGSTMRVAAAS